MEWLTCLTRIRVLKGKAMADKTCAACDCKLEGESTKVKIGGKTVEVCCDDCAQKLKKNSRSTPARSIRRNGDRAISDWASEKVARSRRIRER